MNYVLKNVRVASGRHFLEKVSTDHCATRGQAAPFDLLFRTFYRRGLFENDHAQRRVGFQDANHERTVSATNIDQKTKRREVVY